MPQDNTSVLQNAVDAFNKGNSDALGSLFSKDLQKGASGSVKTARTATSDLQYKIDHIKAEGAHVTFAYTAKGSFEGKAAQWHGSGVATVVDGKITALQHTEDLLSRHLQLGTNPSLSGTWVGSASGITVTLTLVQAGNNVTGNANAFGATFPVTGSVNYPNVSLQGNMNGVQVTFNGAYNPPPNTLPGTLAAMGSTLQVTLTRH